MSFGIGTQLVAVVLVVGLAGAMAIQPTRQLIEQRRRISEMTEDLSRIEHANARLAAAAARLQDPYFLEQQAREQIGLVRPGETTYVVMPPSRRARGRPGARPRPGPVEPSRPHYLERLIAFIGWR